ncbi:lipoyltransferase 1, mitochondrial [Daktulosphaira vitifoliae]|uniref:lipoyltransferase 1, mitochondrial n=1 Tax=Daktulosphaira vitifoliae TaxID=58002 RepID=UPI0021AA6B88|nr:lipoyltransferase 1, mitochondrial [Daktulosphaira vitifoliae]
MFFRRSYSSVKEKSVLISKSNNVFENLALEHWYYQNHDFTNKSLLLLWINHNCVVIGRHQNPWLEVNYDPTRDICLARRQSGGGTVYHDKGNLNLTFFTHKDMYNRKNNLELIAKSLKNEWNIVTKINKREDITIENKYKISGTASRLGRPNAYHHCTLLINCNRHLMSNLLRKHEKCIETNATVSVPSSVINLKEINERISINRLVTVIGLDYLNSINNKNTVNYGFNYIKPDEKIFPGLNKIKEELESWDWRYGRTPKFKITITLKNQSAHAVVKNGIIENISSQMNVNLDKFINVKFSENIIEDIKKCLKTS